VSALLEGEDDAVLLCRGHAAEQVDSVDLSRERVIVQFLKLGPREYTANGDADLRADVLGYELVVAGDEHHAHARLFEGAHGVPRALLGRVFEGREAGEYQLGLIVYEDVLARGGLGLPGDTEHPMAVSSERVELLHHPSARLVIERANVGWAVRLVVGREAQNILERALHDKETLVSLLDQDRNPSSFEIEGHLVDFLPVADVDLLVPQDGLVERALQPGLESAVDVRELEDARAVLAARVEVLVQPNAGFGEGPSLVGAEDVHAPEVVDGSEALDENLLLGHSQRPARERHRNHHREKLGG